MDAGSPVALRHRELLHHNFSCPRGYSKFEYTDLEVEAQGAIRKADSGYEFGEIMIRPKLTISSEEEQPRALRLLEKTKNLCLVSRALSVTQIFEPRVHVTARAELGQAVFVG